MPIHLTPMSPEALLQDPEPPRPPTSAAQQQSLWRGRGPVKVRGLTQGAVLALVLLAGCRQIETRFDVQSFKDPSSPERFTERFDPGAFAIDAQQNWDIVFEIPSVRLEYAQPLTPSSGPASSPAGPLKAQSTHMSQYVHIRVFWKPLPGTTHAESSQTNTSLLYCLTTGANAISYEGGGFVYFTQDWAGTTITGQIESASLVPVRTSNEPIDLFGPCRLTGSFVAHRDRKQVVSVLKVLRKRLGPPAALPGLGSLSPHAQ
jgi:hypothetical protein